MLILFCSDGLVVAERIAPEANAVCAENVVVQQNLTTANEDSAEVYFTEYCLLFFSPKAVHLVLSKSLFAK